MGSIIKRTALLGLLLCLLPPTMSAVSSQSPKVYVITVDGTIGAGIASYVIDAINRASDEGATLVIKLDTPGGLLSATEEIVDRMLEENQGIVVWVTPQGSWAFSAGTYILLASNFAVMDEGTSIGAAQPHPVDPKTTSAMSQWIKEIASLRNRPVEIAELFVENNLTMGPENALAENVVDLIASDLDTILGSLGILHPVIEELQMSAVQKFLQILSHPDIIMLLLILGFFGVLAEITIPGIGIPGILGSICLILSFWGMGILSLNYAGLALLGIGLLMLAYEIFTPGFGVFGGGGIVSIILGLMMVGKEPWVTVVGNLAKGVVMGMVIFLSFALFQVRRSIRKKPVVGEKEIIGELATAVTDLRLRGLVKLGGELWSAQSKTPVRKGEEVVITGLKGNTLIVEKRKN